MFETYLYEGKQTPEDDDTSGRVICGSRRTQNRQTDHPKQPLEPSTPSGLTLNQDELGPPVRNRLKCPKGADGKLPQSWCSLIAL